MSTEKRKSPAATVLLTLGSVATVGLAWWSISNALNNSAGTAPAKSLPPAPANTELPKADRPVARKPVEAKPEEAEMARSADPFVTAGGLPLMANPDTLAVAPPAPAAKPAPAKRDPQLFGSGPTIFPISPMPGIQPRDARAGAPDAEPSPELAGTFLGDRSCAMFREGQTLLMVPVGGKYHAWKVLSVTHGSAILQNGKRTLNLEVGYGQSAHIQNSRVGGPAAETASRTDAPHTMDTFVPAVSRPDHSTEQTEPVEEKPALPADPAAAPTTPPAVPPMPAPAVDPAPAPAPGDVPAGKPEKPL